MGPNCKEEPDECRERLVPVLHNTDIGTHSKRFVLFGTVQLGIMAATLTAELLVIAAVAALIAYEAIPAVKYEYSDMDQIHDTGSAQTIAVQQGPDADAKTITIPAVPIAPTPTDAGEITLETLAADADGHKKGDIVYHIPLDSARRIQDFLAMLGIQDLVDACQGYDLFNPQLSRVSRGKRADTIEQCLEQVARFVPGFMEGIPENAVQLAQRNFPAQPGPGQAIGFPVQNIMVQDVYVVVIPYHALRAHMMPAPVPRFYVPAFVSSAVGWAIVSFVVMHAGQMALDIWLPQNAVSTDITEDAFACPEDILCIEDACGAQEDDVEIEQRNAFCKKVSEVSD